MYGFSCLGHCVFVKSKNINLPCIMKDEDDDDDDDDDDDNFQMYTREN